MQIILGGSHSKHKINKLINRSECYIFRYYVLCEGWEGVAGRGALRKSDAGLYQSTISMNTRVFFFVGGGGALSCHIS
jgi:hypothetical protein